MGVQDTGREHGGGTGVVGTGGKEGELPARPALIGDVTKPSWTAEIRMKPLAGWHPRRSGTSTGGIDDYRRPKKWRDDGR